MPPEIVVETRPARPIAAVHRQVRVGDVGSEWKPALDRVWAYLRLHRGLRTDGHNIFVYHHAERPADPMEVDFGVEVTGPFEGEGDVVFTWTPAGEVASTLHVGPYETLGDAHDAVRAWQRVNGRSFAGASWEIYGDPAGDPETVEVRVEYLLTPVGGTS